MKKPNYIIALMGFLLLAACTPAVQPAMKAEQAARIERELFVAEDGAQLPLRAWMTENPPKAVILALHGFNDYSNAFALPAAYFQAHGVALYAYDQRGFGGAPQTGIWAGEANLIRDVRALLKALKQLYPSTPLFLLGESMGAAVVIHSCAAQGGCPEAQGIILSAPALWGEGMLSDMYQFGAWLMAHSFPASRWTGDDLDIYASDNLEILYAMGQDPLVIKHTRSDAVYGLVQLMVGATARSAQLAVPTLLLYGAKDEVIPPLPVAMAIERMSAPLTVAYYPEGYHMLMRDLQREKVFQDMLFWMLDRYHPLPSGADMGWREELLPVAE